MKFTLKQLEHALALRRLRSYHDACDAVHVSQPALTRSIQCLEDALGIRLFDRLAGGVEPTQTGELLLRHAERTILEATDLEREAQLLRGVQTGQITVSAGPYPGMELVPRAVAAIVERVPALSCRLLSADWRETTQQVLDRRADIAVAETSAARQEPRIEIIDLDCSPMYLICRAGHPLAARRNLSFAEITAHRIAGCTVPARTSGAFVASDRAGSFDRLSGDFYPAIQVGSLEALRRVLMASDTVSGARLCSIEPELRSGQLVVLDVTDNPMRFNVGAMLLRGRTPSPVVQIFVEELRRIAQEMAEADERLRAEFALR